MLIIDIFSSFSLCAALTDAKPTKNSQSNNNNNENLTPSSKNGDIVQHVPPSGHIGDPNLKTYTFAELGAATRNFRTDMVVGEGRFGKVFRGWVDEKTYRPSSVGMRMPIAVKKFEPALLELRELKVN